MRWYCRIDDVDCWFVFWKRTKDKRIRWKIIIRDPQEHRDHWWSYMDSDWMNINICFIEDDWNSKTVSNLVWEECDWKRKKVSVFEFPNKYIMSLGCDGDRDIESHKFKIVWLPLNRGRFHQCLYNSNVLSTQSRTQMESDDRHSFLEIRDDLEESLLSAWLLDKTISKWVEDDNILNILIRIKEVYGVEITRSTEDNNKPSKSDGKS